MKVTYTKSDYISIKRVFRCPACNAETCEPEHGIHSRCESCGQEMVAYGNSLELFFRKGNVVNVSGERTRTIGGMEKGDFGYTIPAAYDSETNTLNQRHRIYESPGAVSTVLVKCVKPGRYEITFNVR